jgi:hypothetical protein
MKTIIWGIVVLMAAALVSASIAQQKSATTSAPTEKLAKFRGVIEKIDEAAKAIEVKGKKTEPLIFSTDEKTKIMIGTKEASFADLKKDLHVVVKYKIEGTKLIAVKITEAVPKTTKNK